MRLQRLLIETNGYDDMYFRGGEKRNDSLFLKQGESVSFDTYFNCFSYTKHRDYTALDGVSFSCHVNGEATVSLYSFDGESRTLLASEAVCSSRASLYADFSSLPSLGILYPVISAVTDCSVTYGEFYTDRDFPSVDCAIAICTYKRESEILKNLEVLSRDVPFGISKIYVIDNGKTLDSISLSDKLISVIPNKNYGGSGGFTRGIMEAKYGGHSHVILMDDDVIVSPEAISRMCAFSSILSPEYSGAHIRASMLPKSAPFLQYEMGAKWNGGAVKSFKQNIDVRLSKNLIECAKDDDIQYGGWWCFMMPLSNTDKIGLPYPMFIKFDDIEYGKRCSSLAPIIAMSGISVIHEDFNVKYSVHLDYYKLRNQLITLSTHNMQNRFGVILRLMKTGANNLFLYRYDAMPLFFKAFDDFMKGPDFLLNTDEEALNGEIMKMSPTAKPLSEIDGWDDSMRSESKKNPSLLKKLLTAITLGGHIIPSFMLKRKIAAFPPLDANMSSAFMHKRTIQYQLGSDYGFDFRRSFKRFFGNFFKCIGMAFRVLFKYGRIKKKYLEKKDYLSSFEFWKSHLEIE